MRVQCLLSDELVSRLDSYSDKIGVSRSALIAMICGQYLDSFDRMNDALTLALHQRFDDVSIEK